MTQTLEIGRSLEASLAQGVDALTPLLDVTGFAQPEWPASVRDAYSTSLQAGARHLGERLAAVVREGGTVTLINQPDPTLVRLRLRHGGFNYVDLRFNESGRVVDWFVYDLGEWFSESHRRLSSFALKEDQRSEIEAALAEHAATVTSMSAALAAKRWASVLVGYWQLPPVLQRDRGLLRMRVAAAMWVDESTYAEALDAFITQCSAGSEYNLMAVDAFLLAHRYNDSLAAVDRLEAHLGDPLLGHLRAGVLLKAGRRDEARQAFETVVEQAPHDAAAYWSLIGLALERRDYAQVARWLRQVVSSSNVALGDLQPIPVYAGFNQSPEGRDWARNHPIYTGAH